MLLLTGCAFNRQSDPPDLLTTSIPVSWHMATDAEGASADNWVASYGDAALSQLVDEAFEHSPSLEAGRARLRRARALTRQATASLRPELNATARMAGSRRGAGDTDRVSVIGLTAAWEADVWGRLSSARRSALFTELAIANDVRAAEFALASGVVESYFVAIESMLQTQEAAANFNALAKKLEFIEVQYDRGLRSGQEIALIRADVARARARKSAAENAERESLRALEILIGRYPSTSLDISQKLPAVPPVQNPGLPADLLRQRPDLLAAEARFRSAVADVDEAIADRMPSLILSGSLLSDDGPERLFRPDAIVWKVAGDVLAPIFDGGRREATVEANHAALEEQGALYRETALAAFSEVENLLDRQSALNAQISDIASALGEARNALSFTTFQFENGEGDLFDVLSVQQRVSSLESNLIRLRQARLVQHARLSLALCGTP
ncbi:MAG: efflux transporter outer membrane subunit [Pseudomonadota bacterium]